MKWKGVICYLMIIVIVCAWMRNKEGNWLWRRKSNLNFIKKYENVKGITFAMEIVIKNETTIIVMDDVMDEWMRNIRADVTDDVIWLIWPHAHRHCCVLCYYYSMPPSSSTSLLFLSFLCEFNVFCLFIHEQKSSS